MEPLTLWAKDRVLLQVRFDLQISGCRSNPKSKGGLFSIIFDGTLGEECTQVGPSKQCSLVSTLRLSLWAQGWMKQGAGQPQAGRLHCSRLVSLSSPSAARLPVVRPDPEWGGVSWKRSAWKLKLTRPWKQRSAPCMKMYEDGLGRRWPMAFPWYFKGPG